MIIHWTGRRSRHSQLMLSASLIGVWCGGVSTVATAPVTTNVGNIEIVGAYHASIAVVGAHHPMIAVVGAYHPVIEIVGEFEE